MSLAASSICSVLGRARRGLRIPSRAAPSAGSLDGLRPGGPAPGSASVAVALLSGLVLVTSAPALGEIRLPPGFTAEVYASGDGFEAGRGARGLPAASTVAFDAGGRLYLARTGRRYWSGGEADDLTRVFRIPVGGAHLRPDTEARFLHGPPLANPQVATARPGLDLFVTTFDRDRRLGALYRLADGRAQLLAGGTPPAGEAPLFRQPEGVVPDSRGNLYVADRERGLVVKLDPTGRVLDERYVVLRRPRALAMAPDDTLWIGADANAEAPWQQGPGEIWRVSPAKDATLVLRGPMPAGIGLGPGGHLFVADRHAGQLFAIGPDGQRVEFAAFTDGDAPRGLGFVPDTPEARRAGTAGDLFVITINRGAWPVNDVVRVAGPFDAYVRRALGHP
jgi:sugar lactone lactonase YvrE